MGVLDIFKRKQPVPLNFEIKQHPSGQAMLVGFPGNVAWNSINKRSFIEYGYKSNPVVYQCVNMIADAVANLPYLLKNGDRDAEDDDPFAAMLAMPNPDMSWQDFIQTIVIDMLTTGEAYLIRNFEAGAAELWINPSLYMSPVEGAYGLPQSYKLEKYPGQIYFPVDQFTGDSDILQLKYKVDPINRWHGLPPTIAVHKIINTYNDLVKFQKATLDNGGQPAGAWIYQGQDGERLTDEQYARMSETIAQKYTGVKNAGKDIFLEGGLTYVRIGQSTEQLSFTESMAIYEDAIIKAFGIPLPLLKNEASTYNNVVNANLKFYEDVVIPLANKIYHRLPKWLARFYPRANYRILPDYDRITALEVRSETKYKRALEGIKGGLITVNEARYMTDFEELEAGEGGDQVLVPQSMIPASMAGQHFGLEDTPQDGQDQPG